MRYLFPLSPYNQQRQFEKPVWVYPAHLAMYATYIRDQGHDVQWGKAGGLDPDPDHWKKLQAGLKPFDRVIYRDDEIDVPFEQLPFPDRIFTNAKDQRYQSYGNYKFKPATHMMASNLCWYGKCTFCIDTAKLEAGEGRGLRTVDHVIAEIDDLIAQGYKEVFDDSGTFPIGKWLDEFCAKMMLNGRNKKIKIGCNMRVQDVDWKMMKAAGFRFILMGIESANQITLDKIKKSQKADDMVRIIKAASDAGLEPHGTFMTGYPWEEPEDEQRTINLCHMLLRKGYLKTAQCSVYSPPRTRPNSNSMGHKYLPRFYDAYRHNDFWYHKIKDIQCWEDAAYLIRAGRLVIEEKWRKLRSVQK